MPLCLLSCLGFINDSHAGQPGWFFQKGTLPGSIHIHCITFTIVFLLSLLLLKRHPLFRGDTSYATSTKALRLAKPTLVALILVITVGLLLLLPGNNVTFPTGKDPLTLQERYWLEENAPNVILAFEPNWPPLSFLSTHGEEQGIVPDHIRLLEQRLQTRFKRVRYDKWSDILTAAYKGEVDIVPAIQQTPERSRHLLFTRAYLSFPTSIITTQNVKKKLTLDDLTGKKICVQKDSALHHHLAAIRPDLNLIPVNDSLSGMLRVSLNEADALVLNQAPITYLAAYHSLTSLRVSGQLDFHYDFRISSGKHLPILRSILDKGLAQITPMERKRILDRWINPREPQFYRSKKFWYGTTTAALLGFLTIMGVLLWNLSLHQQVVRQTAELQRNSFKLQALFEQSFQLIALLETNGRIININRTAREIFKVGEGEVNGVLFWETPWRINRPAESARVKTAVMNAARGEVQRFESKYTIGQSEETILDVTLTPVKDNEGKILFLVAEARDISASRRAEQERLKLESQLQQSQKFQSLTVMAGSIAHNFNNQLQAVIGNLELALHAMPEDSPFRVYLESANHGAQRASQLSSLMLTYVGQRRMNLQRLSLVKILQESSDDLQELLPSGGTLEIALPDETAFFQGDPAMVRQILRNLVSNAAESLSEGCGSVTLSCGVRYCRGDHFLHPFQSDKLEEGQYVFLKVSDTGCGMSEEISNRVFDPFFTTKFTGRGLGLATVLGIVRAHRGGISLSSTPGQGTTMQVFFPAEATAPAP
jgi:PAS domain S-box-containing protein